MMSEFNPEILSKLDPEHRGVVTEEMARLNKENDDLKIENKTIETETIQQMLGMEQNVLDHTYRWEFGPVCFVFTMNELAFGIWSVVDDGCLTILFNFLFFTIGVDIPLGVQDEEDE